MVRFGAQLDYKGIVADDDNGKRSKVGKAIGYLTKYLGKPSRKPTATTPNSSTPPNSTT
ncbi:hypothetical protein [Kribbella sp. CA-294648]|uniref:hypothetical protein n=1 Tax=Kribbella sp. CA-294648 TaxID=3239948 RepID=UPI003D8D111E